MPKQFYTEKDIEDLVRRGILSLEVGDNVVLTDLAYEKANKLGMRLVQSRPDNPPSAPVRPYVAGQAEGARQAERTRSLPAGASTTLSAPAASTVSAPGGKDDLRQRIRSAVIAKLGAQVDPALLDVIIARVLQNTGVK